MIARAHPMELRGGEVIAIHPATGAHGQWTVTGPPVQCAETAEIPVRTRAGQGWVTTSVHTKLTLATSHRQDVIAGLRELADWLETHPDVPVSRDQVIAYSATASLSPLDGRAEVDRIAATLGVPSGPRQWRKSSTHVARRRFAGVVFEAAALGVYPERAR